MSRARLLRHAGRTASVAGWARLTGIAEATIRLRLRRGWPISRALTTPPGTERSGSPVGKLSRDDQRLIRACKVERERLKGELAELTDTALAEKFGTTYGVIRRL